MPKGPTYKHSGCRRGTKVFIKLRSGEEFLDIFIERTPTHLILKEHGRLHKKNLERFVVARPNQKSPDQ